MDNFTAGIALVLTGLFVWFVTYKRVPVFWNFFDTKLIRKFCGDTFTVYLLYFLGSAFIVTGILLSKGIIF